MATERKLEKGTDNDGIDTMIWILKCHAGDGRGALLSGRWRIIGMLPRARGIELGHWRRGNIRWEGRGMNERIHSGSWVGATFINATSLVPYPIRTVFQIEEQTTNRCLETPAQVRKFVTTTDNWGSWLGLDSGLGPWDLYRKAGLSHSQGSEREGNRQSRNCRRQRGSRRKI